MSATTNGSANLDLSGETGPISRLSDDRLEILRMVENHIISAEEANRLLEALDRTENALPPGYPPVQPIPPFPPVQATEPLRPVPSPRLIRFRVSDADGDETMLNLVLPLGLLDSGLKIAKRFTGDLTLDAKELRQSVSEGYVGPLLDINDGGQHVEIIIE